MTTGAGGLLHRSNTEPVVPSPQRTKATKRALSALAKNNEGALFAESHVSIRGHVRLENRRAGSKRRCFRNDISGQPNAPAARLMGSSRER
jgi:hypothetical protein